MNKIGVDTGGTFTDFVWRDGERLHIYKQLSTPQDPAEAILAGLERLQVPEQVAVVHGSTVATNALLEGRGARTALITTRGFADLLAIGRQDRPELYALVPRKPPPLVPRCWRFEVTERVTAAGEPLVILQEQELDNIVEQLQAGEVESVAVCLLFSFLYPAHEQRVRAILREKLASLHISLSAEILPEYREYERTATTVINAYVAPLMQRYLRRLSEGVAPRPLAVMQSNGGLLEAEAAGEQAARTVLSGPAAGVVGARFVAELAGFAEIITFDMGGTSTDVALCPGQLPLAAAGEMAGMPLRLPSIAIHTVGAGGGSLAFVDAGGALHTGPKSAGADPGPACYGRSRPGEPLPVTVTDANLVLGRLDAGHFLGGTMPLDLDRAEEALVSLARQMGMDSAAQAAWDAVRVANTRMERAIRKISVERGHDPRLFTLVAFGGAGPLHACELARQMQIPRVLVPQAPGVLSALGMLVALPTRDYSRTVMHKVAPATALKEVTRLLDPIFSQLQELAAAEMAAAGHKPEQLTLRRSLDMRYAGQSHELTVPFTGNCLDNFHEAHQQQYGYERREMAVELVTVRLQATGPAALLTLPRPAKATTDVAAACLGEKAVWFDGAPVPTMLYERDRLGPGHQFGGPAIIFQYDTTTVVPPDWEVSVDPLGNLLLTFESSL